MTQDDSLNAIISIKIIIITNSLKPIKIYLMFNAVTVDHVLMGFELDFELFYTVSCSVSFVSFCYYGYSLFD